MGRYAVMDRGSGSARLHGQGIWQCEVARVAGRAVAHHPGKYRVGDIRSRLVVMMKFLCKYDW